MSVLAFLLAAFLDPISFVLAFVLSLLWRRWWSIPVIGVVVASVVETILNFTNPGYFWGMGLIVHLLTATTHAALSYAIIRPFRRRAARNRQATRIEPSL